MEETDYPVDWEWYKNAEVEKNNDVPTDFDRYDGTLTMGHEGTGWIESNVFFMDVSKNA